MEPSERPDVLQPRPAWAHREHPGALRVQRGVEVLEAPAGVALHLLLAPLAQRQVLTGEQVLGAVGHEVGELREVLAAAGGGGQEVVLGMVMVIAASSFIV